MKVIQNGNEIKVTLVCCIHGDEIFGKKVFDYFGEKINSFPGLQVIFANEIAYDAKKRFITDDLNRCFPGIETGENEQKLAFEISKEIKKTEYLIDLHTTTSDLKITPIALNLNIKTKQIINLTSSKEVVLMSHDLAKYSLIGQVKNGISLEIGEKYSKDNTALQEILTLITDLLGERTKLAINRKVFSISETIPPNLNLPKGTRNFKIAPSLNIYPFLIGEKSYISHQGFAAKSFQIKKI